MPSTRPLHLTQAPTAVRRLGQAGVADWLASFSKKHVTLLFPRFFPWSLFLVEGSYHSEQIVFDENLLNFRHELGQGLHGHTFWC